MPTPALRRRPAARPRPRAFTLIELLAVIAIVALLIGILLPALSAARRAGITAACLSNIRQIEIAHTLYMGDNKEYFIDAGLGHGGLQSPEDAWPVALEPYYGAAPVIRSPGDKSPSWHTEQGGQCTDLTLDEALQRLAEGQPVDEPLCRWTSYGLNSFTTRFAQPSVQDPETGRWLGPYDRLARIDRPYATVHFVQMTEGIDGDPEYARADHVHAEDFSSFGPESAPNYATLQMEIHAHGGRPRTWDATANYGFLDGHAATLKFKDVYTSAVRNKFCPEYAH